MAIAKITDAARDAASVGAMADRPNSTARDGYSGLTPEQVKAKFDALPFINTAKINEIIDLINGSSTLSLAYLMQTPVEYQGETLTLYEFLEAVQDGSFGDVVMIGDDTLTSVISALYTAIAAANKVPAGGTTGQVLGKKTGADYDLKWIDPQSGGEANVIESISYNNTPLTVTNKNVELKPTIDSAIAGKENAGKIKISGTEYTVTRKALTITENGTTTTYYVADIT